MTRHVTPFRRLALLLSASGSLLAGRALAAPAARPLAAAASSPTLVWVDDYDKALAQAKKEKRLVLVDFQTSWCGWCRRLEADVFSQASFQTAASGIIGCKVDAEKHPEIAQRYAVNSYPRLFFLNPDGLTIERINGYLNLADFTAKVVAVKHGDTELSRLREAANDPTNLPAILNYARLLSDGRQYEQAIPYWQQVHDLALQQVFLHPEDMGQAGLYRSSLLELGRGYASVGLTDVARQHFDETMKSYPQTMEAAAAMAEMAQLELTTGNAGKAGPLAQQVMRAPAAWSCGT